MSLLLMGVGSYAGAAAAGNTNSIDLESGSSQTLTAADSTSLSITGDLTIEAWVKVESAPANNTENIIVSKWDSNGNNRAYKFGYFNDAGTLKLQAGIDSDGASASQGSVAQTLTIGTWFHVAMIYTASAGKCEFVVDGTSIGAVTGFDTAIFDNAETLDIGAQEDGASRQSFWDGLIDDVRVWNVARTVAQISDNRSTQIDSATNLQGSWHLNNSLSDSSGNGNTLTNVGSAVFSTDVPF